MVGTFTEPEVVGNKIHGVLNENLESVLEKLEKCEKLERRFFCAKMNGEKKTR